MKDEKIINFTTDFFDLHSVSYKNILDGKGFVISDVKPSIKLVSELLSQINYR